MRYILLKHIKDDAERIDFAYKDAILAILRTPAMPERGITYGEIEQALNVIQKTKARETNEYLALEDAEHTYAADRFKSHGWPSAHEVFRDFVHDFVNAPKTMPKSLSKKTKFDELPGVDNRTATGDEMQT